MGITGSSGSLTEGGIPGGRSGTRNTNSKRAEVKRIAKAAEQRVSFWEGRVESCKEKRGFSSKIQERKARKKETPKTNKLCQTQVGSPRNGKKPTILARINSGKWNMYIENDNLPSFLSTRDTNNLLMKQCAELSSSPTINKQVVVQYIIPTAVVESFVK